MPVFLSFLAGETWLGPQASVNPSRLNPLTLWTCSSPAHHSSGPVPATLFRSLASRRVKVAKRTDLALTCVKKRSFQRHGDVEKLRDDLSI
jgi:hypothetical protein